MGGVQGLVMVREWGGLYLQGWRILADQCLDGTLVLYTPPHETVVRVQFEKQFCPRILWNCLECEHWMMSFFVENSLELSPGVKQVWVAVREQQSLQGLYGGH